MKKLLFIFVAMTVLLVGCAKQGGAPVGDSAQSPLSTALSTVSFEKDSTTKIQLNITGGDNNLNQALSIVVNVGKTDYDLSFTADKTINVSGDLTGGDIQKQLATDFENRLSPPQGAEPDDGAIDQPAPDDGAQALALLKNASDLFVLNEKTVRGVEIIDGEDNTITYVIDLFESQVKAALPVFEAQFESVVDVTGLSFKIIESGTKTQIVLSVNVIFDGSTEQSTISLIVEHTRIVKVID